MTKFIIKPKKAEISEISTGIIIILVLVFLGLVIIFAKLSDFKSALGM